jgi:hypothetical protein
VECLVEGDSAWRVFQEYERMINSMNIPFFVEASVIFFVKKSVIVKFTVFSLKDRTGAKKSSSKNFPTRKLPIGVYSVGVSV